MKLQTGIILAISTLAYLFMAYGVERDQFYLLYGTFVILFAGYFLLINKATNTNSFPWLLGAALLFRLLFLPALPELSDDFYRYIWDGRLLAHGINPFLHLPEFYMQEGNEVAGLSKALFQNLNSPEYFTIYPPVNQGIFWLAGTVFPESIRGSVILMRMFILLAEGGSLWLMLQLCKQFKVPQKQVLWYALNPLVIVELTGNLHFEALMIVFLLLGMYFLCRLRAATAAIPWALSIASKLIPLLFLPFLIRRLGWKRFMVFGLVMTIMLAGLFLPFLNAAFLQHFADSFSLYFQKFEFNASVYYIIREIGYWFYGYNIIDSAGIWLAGAVFVLVVGMAVADGVKTTLVGLWKMMLYALTIYLFLSTTVHPWYITTLIALAVFAGKTYPLIWSALIPLSYFTYCTPAYEENLWLVGIEYIAVLGWVIWEWQSGRVQPFQGLNLQHKPPDHFSNKRGAL